MRLVSAEKWDDQAKKLGPAGYTVWSFAKGTGKPRVKHVSTVVEAVTAALKA